MREVNNVYQVPLPKWIKAQKYQEMSGVSPDSIQSRKRSGKLIEGVHWILDPCGHMMVNWREMDNWVEHGFKAASGH